MSEEKTVLNIRIDADVKYKAAEVFQRNGLTIADAVRIFMKRTADDGKLPMVFDEESYEHWLNEKLDEAVKNRKSTKTYEEYVKEVLSKYAQ